MNAPMPAEASVVCGPAAFVVVDAIALPGVKNGRKTRDTRTNCTSHGCTVRVWQPRCRRLASLDRWLCVPAFRRVCLCHCAPPKVGVRAGESNGCAGISQSRIAICGAKCLTFGVSADDLSSMRQHRHCESTPGSVCIRYPLSRLVRRQAPGLIPAQRRKHLLKWGWSVNPQASAIMQRGCPVDIIICLARSILRAATYTIGGKPRACRKAREK